MSILRDSTSQPPPPSPGVGVLSSTVGAKTKPRSSSSASSRNDLFNTSWKPDLPPPKPLLEEAVPLITSTSTMHSHTLPTPSKKRELGLKMDIDHHVGGIDGSGNVDVDEFGVSSLKTTQVTTLARAEGAATAIASTPSSASRTSSFFDLSSSDAVTPPPAPRLGTSLHHLNGSSGLTTGGSSFNPSPLNLSRASSFRHTIPPPLPLEGLPSNSTTGRSVDFSIAGPSTSSSRQPSWDDIDPLSPLHQSPQLPPSSSAAAADWQPPLPPSSEDIELRLLPNSTYLLGEGRYAKVFLAAYKQNRKGKGRSYRDLLGRGGGSVSSPQGQMQPENGDTMEVNENGDGLVGGSWRLCAAKRLAPDRESQTMGLREAFFLHRLAGTKAKKPTSVERGIRSARGGSHGRNRAVSPLRDGFNTSASTSTGSSPDRVDKPKRNGSVYVVKLIAVKEDIEGYPSNATHARSTSDALRSGTGTLIRQRSSTLISAHAPLQQQQQQSPKHHHNDGGVESGRPELSSLASFPSLPSLGQAVRNEHQPRAVSRLVLLLEHAPLGTLDRMLRTSPQLVGKKLWERWAREGAEALEWVHGKGVVHADIKPGNLLVTTDLHIRLSDFGSSLLIHPAHPPTDGLGLGTLPFSPPELVDPNQTFSFPVDIFALGATLYQCITGREPFRGSRTIEMMHHVRKGGLWAYEERERLHRVGNNDGVSVGGSPYPSAWRAAPSSTASGLNQAGVRRTGSLRVQPSNSSRDHLLSAVSFEGLPPYRGGGAGGVGSGTTKPKLKRMTSTESIRASDEVENSESPSGVKLWANWIKNGPAISASPSGSAGLGKDAVALLLSEGEDFASPISPTAGISRASSMRRAQEMRLVTENGGGGGSYPTSRRSSTNSSPIDPQASSNLHVGPGSGLPPAQIDLTTPSPLSVQSTRVSTPPQVPSPSCLAIPDNPTTSFDEAEMEEDQLIAETKETIRQLTEPYEDGSPSMVFLDGADRVREEVRQVLRGMLEPDQRVRLTAREVRERWDLLGVGVGEGDEDDQE
ncbi:hypothetical protein CI109_102452 [Kwoniella shandongensis]|uniref:Uncharacterized protein n=1 Tax=Kwoniella shandongensis TaxID=1734106 RepID=A0A5M6C0V2_9TREE|nr:uncharacterized protein CI109_003229 [Kwoniella shandongensis]KAA5528331.1 hypothetical protein CI109_003229 [Kwoniella shandongensis]